MGEVISYTKEGMDALIAELSSSGTFASQEDIDAAIAALVDTAPGTLNTLNELAAALGDDPNLAITIAGQIGTLDTRVDDLESAPAPDSLVKFPVNTQTVDYTLALVDRGKVVEIDAATGKNVTVPSTPGVSTIASDNFDRANAADVGAPWVEEVVSGSDWKIVSNRAVVHGANRGGRYVIGRAGDLPDGYRAGSLASANVIQPGSGTFGGVALGVDKDNCYAAMCDPGNPVVLKILKRSAGVWSELVGATSGPVDTSPVDVSLRITGNLIEALAGTTVVASVSDGTIADGSWSGLVLEQLIDWGAGNETTTEFIQFDSWSVGALVAIFEIGDVVRVRQHGAGAATIVAGGGVTVTGPLFTSVAGDEIWLHMRAANDWRTFLIPKDLTAIIQNTQTDSYQLVLTDAGKVVEMDKATAVNLTVPDNATVAFPIGTVIEIWQKGAGQVTIVPAGGVTIRSTEGKLKLYGQYVSASLRKRATNEWVLVGDLAA